MGMTPGTRFGPYEIRAALEVPGLGELYDAWDHDQQRDVTFSVLRVDFAAAPDRLKRFEQESHAAARLVHPSILTVHDIGTDAEAAYVVSEPIAKRTLGELVEVGPLPAATAARYAADLASGLAAAHSKGVTHRDLTPAHVLVTAEGGAKIVGLGLATATQKASPLAGGALLGTLSYMSPEQLHGATVDERSDMFTFGAILYEMLTGARAFGGGTLDTMSAVMESQPAALLAPEIPGVLSGIVGRCLTRDPDSRMEAEEVIKALQDLEAQPPPAAEVPETAVPVTRRRFGRAAAIGGAIGLAAVVGVWVFSAWGTREASSPMTPSSTTPPSATTSEVAPSPAAAQTVDASSGAASSIPVSPGPASTAAEAAAPITGPRLVWFDRSGVESSRVGAPGDYGDVSLSPDGTRVAVSLRAPGSETADIWVIDAVSGVGTRITSDPADDIAPVWSADGRRMVFASSRGGTYDIYERAGDGGGSDTAVVEAVGDQTASDWSSERRYLIYHTDEPEVVAGGNLDLWARRRPGGRPFAYLRTVHAASHATFSPDGSHVAYSSVEGGREDVYLAAFPRYDGRRRVSVSGGSWPRWSRDGGEVFYLDPDNQLMAASVDQGSPDLGVSAPRALFQLQSRPDRGYPYDVSVDGQRVLVSVVSDASGEAVGGTPR